MNDIKYKLKKIFSRKLTLMIVPHGAFRAFNFHFTFSFALFMLLLWTGLTSWATWVVTTNIDYWSMKVNHQVMNLKIHYFVKELNKSRELVDQVRQADMQLRQLLGMKDRQTIVEAGDLGKGGAE